MKNPTGAGLLSRQPRMRTWRHLWQLCSSNRDPHFIDAETDQRNLIICPSHTPVPAPKLKNQSAIFYTKEKDSMKQQGGEDLCSLFSGLYFASLRSKVLFCEDPDHSMVF